MMHYMPTDTRSSGLAWCLVGLVVAAVGLGCDGVPLPPDGDGPPPDARYIGSSACLTCHAGIMSDHQQHGHAQVLKPIQGAAPVFPAAATRAGVPDPPAGFEWSDISYVIGGYTKAALFVDRDGFVLTDGTAGAQTQFKLALPAAGATDAEFHPYLPGQATPLGYDHDCFRCHTTGPQSLAENGGLRQENRPGIGGTWAEPGVQCEACHGPGSVHVPNPTAGNISVDTSAAACGRCHVDRSEPEALVARDGLVSGYQQFTELQASPHAGFGCTVCHNPHASTIYDRANGIRNDCLVCHGDQNMALHEGKVYVRGDYSEPVTCESCHMPFAGTTQFAVEIELSNGTTARLGDTRSHIFKLNPGVNSQEEMFSPDGTRVTVDQDGKASVSTCFVCQRCHNGLGNAFAFPANEGCAVGVGIHGTP